MGGSASSMSTSSRVCRGELVTAECASGIEGVVVVVVVVLLLIHPGDAFVWLAICRSRSKSS